MVIPWTTDLLGSEMAFFVSNAPQTHENTLKETAEVYSGGWADASGPHVLESIAAEPLEAQRERSAKIKLKIKKTDFEN